MAQQAADELADQVRAQGPAIVPIAINPGHVRHAGEHRPAIGHSLRKIDMASVNPEGDLAHHGHLKAGRGDHHVAVDAAA